MTIRSQAGYHKQDAAGCQTLMHYAPEKFSRISMADLLNGRVESLGGPVAFAPEGTGINGESGAIAPSQLAPHLAQLQRIAQEQDAILTEYRLK